MPWAINISRENQKIKIILEEIDYKLVAKHVEKIKFHSWAMVFQDCLDLKVYSASSSEHANNHPLNFSPEVTPQN
jgi:general stress protein 26